jgi:hypothetical protein
VEAQYDDGADSAPAECPGGITPSGYFQGHWFYSVRMARVSNPGGGNVAVYTNLDEPVSADGKWLWISGGGTFTCWRQYVPGGYFDYQTLVPPSNGVLIPAPQSPRDGQSPPQPPAGGNGGDTYTGPIVGGGLDPFKRYCDYIDWYTNGVYVWTQFVGCWVG